MSRVDEAKKVSLLNLIDTKKYQGEIVWINDKSVKIYNNGLRYRQGGETGSQIDFIMKFKNLNFIEAVNYILSEKLLIPNSTYKPEPKKQEVKKEEEKEEVIDFEEYLNNIKIDNNFGSFRYLCSIRKIDIDIFKYFVKQGLIIRGNNPYDEEYNNKMDKSIKDDKTLTYFVYKNPWNKSEITGFSARENRDYRAMTGNKTFKLNVANTKYGFNFLKGKPETLVLFEAPIDLLSYLTLYKGQEHLNNKLYSATGGSNKKLMMNLIDEFIEKGGNKIIFNFDNDDFGEREYQFILSKYKDKVAITRETPEIVKVYKDWNEMLVNNTI